MKPGDLYVGVMDFFAILLPGASLTAFLEGTFKLSEKNLDPELVQKVGTEGRWIAFLLASYAAGHLVFLIASRLDSVYDRYRRIRWPDRPGNAYLVASELRRKYLGPAKADSMNTFSWAKAVLLLQAPTTASAVERYEADSKFFRSAFVVLVTLGAGLTWDGDLGYALIAVVLAALAFLRYADRRYQSTTWAYRFVIAFFSHGPTSSPTGKAGADG